MNQEHVEDIYELSPMQQGMLFHSVVDPTSGLYVEQFHCELHGDLCPELVERAWQEVIDQHAILRTSFYWEEIEKPLQVVNRKVDVELRREDWQGLSHTEIEERLQVFLATERDRGFDLATPPLMRFALIRLDEETHRFVWSYHHLLLDGWSLRIVVQHFFDCYDAFCHGRPPTVYSGRPFSDYIAWLQRQDAAASEAFWRETLRGFTAPTPLGMGRSPALGPVTAKEVDTEELHLGAPATAALRSFSRRGQLTLNTLTQAVWAILLSRYSGERDVVFGSVVSGRPADLPEVESMVGLFINTLPLRARFDAHESLADWMGELQARQAVARRFECTPLHEIRGWSEVAGATPLFDSILVFQNVPLSQAGETRLVGKIHFFETTNLPLTLEAGVGEQLVLRAQYDRRRFERAAIRRLLGHFGAALEAIPTHSDRRPLELPLLSPHEQHQVLVDWNDTSTELAGGPRMWVELFVEQAGRTPVATAATFEGQAMSYEELDRRSGKLARVLVGKGVRLESVVALLGDRNLEFLVAIVAVFKSGGAYLPLDPRQPGARQRQLLKDSRACCLLASARYLPAAWDVLAGIAGPSPRLLALASVLEQEAPQTVRLPRLFPDSLAYVIYTSGSTGTPKGAMVDHRGMLNNMVAKVLELELGAEDVVAQTGPQFFDISIWQLLVSLLVGGRVAIFGNDLVYDPRQLMERMEEEGVSVFEIVPSLLRSLFETYAETGVERPRFELLRWPLLTGEALPPELCREWLALYPHIPMVNVYGPTECAGASTHYVLRQPPAPDMAHTPVGHPLVNVRLYVLSRALVPQPLGVPGELCIAGFGVGRGYLGRAARTAQVFVPDPAAQHGGGRLYRTGDLVRWLPSGDLEFLHRLDHQVKIRGNRIEPGEIEVVLNRHPAVREAVVVSRRDGGEAELVAYLVPDGPAPAIAELRDELGREMPRYMVPAFFVFLESMPLTPNGKVDRRSLPAPDARTAEIEAAYVAPRTPTEEQVAEIWREVLGVDRVGIHDDFFELGGHSLSAMRVLSRIHQELELQLSLTSLFDRPTLAEIGFLITEKQQAASASDVSQAKQPTITRSRRDGDSFPLSFAQQRLWLTYQLDSSSPVYNISGAFRSTGRLRVTVLDRALNEIVRRHDALRTTFAVEDGNPVQRIARPAPFVLPLIDLSSLAPECSAAETRKQIAGESRRPFDLELGPPFRFELLHEAGGGQVLFLALHHIVSDGWSIENFLHELETLYQAFSAGEPSPLAELPCQYVDFAVWQREWLQGPILDEELAFWKRQLAQAPAVLDLPTDRPRPAVRRYHGAQVSRILPAPLCAALKQLGDRERATPFMTLLAAFQALLHRYTGQEKLPIGTPIANRDRLEVEGLIGFFVNTLVLLSDMSGQPTFRDLLERVRGTVLNAHAHAHLPFETLVEELQPQRDPSYSPLFQAVFLMQSLSREKSSLSALNLEALPVETVTAKFDLTLEIDATGDELLALFEYNTDLFDTATVMRWQNHFQNLLRKVVADPAQSLSEVEVLSPPEHSQILHQWNDTRRSLPRELCIHRRFETCSEQSPEALAVVLEGEGLSYRELNRRANRLAHCLRHQGVGPEVLVGVALDRSVELVVAFLAVLKAGGVYMPIDPAHPRERTEYLLEDSQVPVLLTRRTRLGSSLPESGLRVVDPDADRNLIEEHSGENPAVGVRPENLAYVIYTSGSTGLPKAAQLAHRGACALHRELSATFGLGPSDRALQFSSLNYDASIFEMIAPLLAGGTLVLGRRETLLPSEDFMKWLDREKVSWMVIPPSALAAIPHRRELPALRTLTVAGEACTAELVAGWAPGRRFFNAYGPTEATVCVTAAECRGAERKASIGRPIGNLRLYPVDRHLRPVPVGVAGELHVGGIALARGYLRRPRLSAEKFVPDPFTCEPGERLYKTGDTVRYLPDGRIEFIGRVDHQVKVRGFRIELGEIESVLAEHPEVRANVVVAREDRPGIKQLAAYVVPCHGVDVTVTELVDFLAERLPNHMVPAAWMVLDALPLTPNGKVDRKALPVPDFSHLASDFLAPRNPTEKLLADIWSEVLGVEKVGADDNFFRLGGDSILSIRVSTRASQAGIKLTPRDLFLHPTLAELAPFVGTAAPAGTAEQGLVTGAVPLSPLQRWFLESAAADFDHWNQASMFTPQRALDPGLLRAAVDHLLEHHDELRARFYRDREGVWLQEVPGRHPGGFFCHCDLSSLPAHERRPVLEAAAGRCQASLDLERGDLVRVVHFHLGPEDPGRVLLIFHHLVVDGVSWRILLEDLQTAYEHLEAGRNLRLPAKTTSFQHWSHRLEELAASSAVEQEQAYWLAAVNEGGEALATGGPARSLRVSLTRNETRAVLRELPAACGADVHAVLLSALVSAAGPIRIDLESHGREEAVADADLTRTVGFFTSAFPVALELPSVVAVEDRPRVILDQLQRIPRHGLGYGLLRFVSPKKQVRRRMASLPRSQLLFNYLGQLDSTFSPAALLHPAEESVGPESARRERSHPLDVALYVRQDQMWFDWTWCEDAYRQEDVERLAHGCLEELRTLMGRTRRAAAPEKSPAARLVPLQPIGRRVPIYCAHPADGKALCYLDLVRHLHPDQPVYGVECSAVNEEAEVSIAGLGARYADMIRAAQPRGPYCIGGISFGGLVAFEIAQHLVRQGHDVALLALFDAWSPRYQGRLAVEFDPVDDLGADLVATARTWVRIHGGQLVLDVESVRGMEPGEQLDYVMNEVAKVGAISTRAALSKVRQALAMNQRHFLALTRYRATQVYPRRITLFRARDMAAIDTLQRHAALDDPAHGWGELSGEPIEIHEIPGDHHTMMLEPHVRILAAKLQACLDRAAGLTTSPDDEPLSRSEYLDPSESNGASISNYF